MDWKLIFSRTAHPEKAEELYQILQKEKIRASIPEVPLIRLLGSSNFAYREIIKNPEIVQKLALFYSVNQATQIIKATLPEHKDEEALLNSLRKWRNLHYMNLIASDISGFISVKDTIRIVSFIADAAINNLLKFYFPLVTGEKISELERSGFFVTGMGKLGGEELNFSSDVDLIFMYGKKREFERKMEARGKTSEEVFNKLTLKISRALDQKRESGFIFRTDLRLRPAGEKGPLCPSTDFAIHYYEEYGQTWERSAYIKARIVAGDREAGEKFLKNLEPFIYRRTLDYTTIEDLRVIKEKINKEALWREKYGWNVKLGKGGIREIEFIVQTLQLIFGGKKKNLREKNTFNSLLRLYSEGLLQREEFYKLYTGYAFLRRIENALQMEYDTQTQLLEFTDDKLLATARKVGYLEERGKAIQNFKRDIQNHRSNISKIFDSFFKKTAPESYQYFPIESMEISEDELEEFTRENLSFLPVEEARKLVALLRSGGKKWVPPQNLEYLHRLIPAIMESLKESPDPVEAFHNLDKFLSKVITSRSFLALLYENEGVTKFLIKLFGTSNYLSNLFINHPELMDELVLTTYTRIKKGKKDFEKEVTGIISQDEDTEAILDQLRRYKNGEILRIGIHDIGGKLNIFEVTEQLSDLAEVIVKTILKIVYEELKVKYGTPVGGNGEKSRLYTIAMGKLGGREINYHSDLDLIFVYTLNGETTGPKKISNIEFYTKMIQKFITYLSVPTKEGKLYEIDMRLRPSGKAGPLVTSFNSFREYHSRESAIWEKLALTRARVLEKDNYGMELERIIQKSLLKQKIGQPEREEIARIRKRMEDELVKNKYEFKYSPGGLVDIEFITQYLMLAYSGKHPDLLTQNT